MIKDKCPTCGFYFYSDSDSAMEVNLKEKETMSESKTGKYAIIRPNSQSGHSPSDRYETVNQATKVAIELAERNSPTTFEVVRIVKRVTTIPKARVTTVR